MRSDVRIGVPHFAGKPDRRVNLPGPVKTYRIEDLPPETIAMLNSLRPLPMKRGINTIGMDRAKKRRDVR